MDIIYLSIGVLSDICDVHAWSLQTLEFSM